jgi:hypothetical protein
MNVCHFGMIGTTTLRLWRRGHFQWNELPTEFHYKLPTGSKVDGEGIRHRQGGDLISLHFFFRKEIRLKISSVRDWG